MERGSEKDTKEAENSDSTFCFCVVARKKCHFQCSDVRKKATQNATRRRHVLCVPATHTHKREIGTTNKIKINGVACARAPAHTHSKAASLIFSASNMPVHVHVFNIKLV